MSSQPSQLRSEAARVNGAKSQGPSTPEGRARSSQNAFRHGLASASVVIPGENPAEFEELRASYIHLFHPSGLPELELAETMAAARWRLRRITRIETELLAREQAAIDNAFSSEGDFNANLASNFDDMAAGKTAALLIRYERQLTRTYESARKELQIIQKMKVGQASACQPEKVQNEPKREPVPTTKPRLVRQNEPNSAPSPAPLPEVTPALLRETPMVGTHSA